MLLVRQLNLLVLLTVQYFTLRRPTAMLSQLKAKVKKLLSPVPTDFDQSRLPWIDHDDADIDGFVKAHPAFAALPYDMAEKLHFWQKNGYVVLEQVIPHTWIDVYLQDVEELIEHHNRYNSLVRIDLPEFAANPVQPVSAVSKAILRGKYLKIMDFHNSSVAGKKLMLHPAIVTFLNAVFGDQTVAMQSLTFMHGSQQATHQDFAYVVSQEPSHLAASWIALEDIQPGSGPLYYYPGSHQVKKFNFGNGIFFDHESKKNPDDFGRYLDAECQRLGMTKKTLLIKKGDVLLWHAALAHGGEAIHNDELTRKSYVCHYSSAKGYTRHRSAVHEEPIRYEYGGGVVFEHPLLRVEENSFKAGEQL